MKKICAVCGEKGTTQHKIELFTCNLHNMKDYFKKKNSEVGKKMTQTKDIEKRASGNFAQDKVDEIMEAVYFNIRCECVHTDKVNCGCLVREAINLTMKQVENMIKNHSNPYPKDIFLWDNKEDMKITRGRFNEFIHILVESVKHDLIKEIKDGWDDVG